MYACHTVFPPKDYIDTNVQLRTPSKTLAAVFGASHSDDIAWIMDSSTWRFLAIRKDIPHFDINMGLQK